jgi:UDP-N-acetylglucosamine 2-epimerase (non-hydrolysing)/GDP/UDP-N,N'-diacetylbacillosamine 2-epimerase (hydrolysing)
VAVVTGTRAEYGLLHTVIKAIAARRELELQLVATGIHLLKSFGATVREIERDGWPVDARIPMQRGHDDPLDQAEGLARGVKGIARFLHNANTDIVVVLGDRIEAMAGALAASTTGRFIAHIHGGDVAPGDTDESLRHAITKLAHVHLAASTDAARRIKRMGEPAEMVHVVGAPGLDRLFELAREQRRSTRRSSALILQHAYGRKPAVEHRVMSAILRAVRSHNLSAKVIYPNTDRGHSGVTRAIDDAIKARKGNRRPHVVRSLPRDKYLRELLATGVLVGNSSSGVLEAAAAGVPCVNVGSRQAGRLRAGASTIDAGESYPEIHKAIGQALTQRPGKTGARRYGDGHAGERIAEVLAATPLSEDLRRKRIPS